MRERLWTQRMLALYRSGRQAEALRVFEDLRTFLVAELGIEPGHDVTWMEHAILAQDPALDVPYPPEEETGRGPGRRPRRSLSRPSASTRSGSPPPGARGVLVGRERENGAAERLVDVGGSGGGPPAAGRRRSGHRQDAPRGRAGAHGREAGRSRPAGSLRRGSRGTIPTVRGGVGRYFASLSADRISHMPDWQLTELSGWSSACASTPRRWRTRAVTRTTSGSASSKR